MPEAKLPDSAADLFEKKSLGYFSTLMPDGVPHVTPVWVGREGDLVLVNTAKGRVKDRNVRANAAVGILVRDPDDKYRWLSVQGDVVEIREEGADAHIDLLSNRYLGKDYPNRRPGEVREILVIKPRRVHGMGL